VLLLSDVIDTYSDNNYSEESETRSMNRQVTIGMLSLDEESLYEEMLFFS